MLTDEVEINDWLQCYYPQLVLRRMPNGGWGIWQQDKRYEAYDFNGYSFASVVTGYSIVFDVRNRLPGGWVKDEVQRRDPRLWHNPGNFYHDGFQLSKIAESNYEKRKAHAKESALMQWDACKRNENLMNRVFKKMERGDMSGAAKEFSLEEMCRNAYLENPREIRNKDFWKVVRSFK